MSFGSATFEQFLDSVTTDRRNDPELGKMSPDRIDHRGLLTDEQMARAVQHQAALLLGFWSARTACWPW